MSSESSASLGSQVTGFFSWWGHELLGLVPGAGIGSAETGAARTVISVATDGLQLIETNGAKNAPRPDGVVPQDAMLAYLSNRIRTRNLPGGIALRLPFSACFVRRLDLPAAARADFGRMLAVDLERSTPFKMKDVMTAYDVENEPNAKGMVKVRQLILKRKSIDGLTADIEALGLKIVRVDCTEPNGQGSLAVNFLARGTAVAGAAPRSSPLGWVLALTVLGLTASGLYFYVDRHQQALAALQETATKLRAKSQLQKDALTKSQAAFAEIASYQKLRAETVSKVAILEELTRILPETAWVTDLKIDGSTVDLSGLAVSAAALVPILERSKVFVDATSTASLTLDPREERERFSIRARIRSATTGGAQAVETEQ